MSAPLKLIVGLGNPGPQYQLTRHNAGFWFIDALASKLSLNFKNEKKFAADICRYQQAGYDCWLCKPQTFMNESGISVQALMNFYKIEASQVLVIHDEIDLNPGTARFKQGGGHGGNNGLRDIIEKTGNKNFQRLRIGVGHPGSKDKVVSYVLGRPDKQDEALIVDSIAAIIDDYQLLFSGEFQKLMNSHH